MNHLNTSIAQYRVLDRLPQGIFILKVDGRVIYWNQCLEQWTGIEKTQILGQPITNFFSHLHPLNFHHLLESVCQGQKTQQFNCFEPPLFPVGTLANGQPRLVQMTVVPEPAGNSEHYALFSLQEVSVAPGIETPRSPQPPEDQSVEEQLKAVLDAVPGLVSWISSDLHYLGVNRHLCHTFNQPPEAFVGKKLNFLSSSQEFAEFMQKFLHEPGSPDRTVITAQIQGEKRNYLIASQKYQQGQAAVAVGIDITEQKQIEAQLTNSLKEKEVLLKEIHHRVKNNLQIISSLLKLQSEYIQDPMVVSLFKDSYNRVRSMALIHEHLYQSLGLAQIEAERYIQNLVTNLTQSYHFAGLTLNLQIQVDPILLDIDTAIPCGLILNELICNALKYAFPGQKNGQIEIWLRVLNEGEWSLGVQDNGVGLPAEFDLEQTDSLGLQLVVNLTQQLEGELIVMPGQGTGLEVRFPKPCHSYPVSSHVA